MELLGTWPPFPVVIMNELDQPLLENYDFDIAIIQRDRLCHITVFHLSGSQLQRLVQAAQGSFPALIRLLRHFDRNNSHAAPPHPRR